MSDFHQCSCGHKFPISEDDRGFTAYCPSCGSECQIPAGDPENSEQQQSPQSIAPSDKTKSTPRAPRKRSVFSSEGLSIVAQKKVDPAVCPNCRHPNEIVLADLGTQIYCEKCHSEFYVKTEYEQEAESDKADGKSDESKQITTPLGRQKESALQKTIRYLATAVILASLPLGLVFTESGRNMLPAGMREWVIETVGTNNEQDQQSQQPDSQSEPEDEEFQEGPDFEITLEAIETLFAEEDKQMVLFEAKSWQKILEDDDVEQEDPRIVRLQKGIAALEELFAPQDVASQAEQEKLNDLLRRLYQALTERNLLQATPLYQDAKKIVDAYPDSFTYERQRLARLAAKIQELEYELNGITRIETLFKEARASADQENPTDAIEKLTRAIIMAYATPNITEQDEARLKSMLEELKHPLSLSRGRKATNDAEACQQERDRDARDNEISIALRLLPEIPETLPGIGQTGTKELLDRVKSLRESRISSTKKSDLGRELLSRHLYEDALEHLGQGNLDSFIASCSELADANQNELPPDMMKLLSELFFARLERMTQLLDLYAQSPKRERTEVEQLQAILARASMFKSEPQWQVTSNILTQRRATMTMRHILDAERLAEADQLTEAIALLNQIEKFENQELEAQAKADIANWSKILRLKRDAELRKQQIERVDNLVELKRWIDAANELHQLKANFPKDQNQDDLSRLKSRIGQAELDAEAERQLAQIETLQGVNRNQELNELMTKLEHLALSESVRQKVDQFQSEYERIKTKRQSLLLRIKLKLETPTWDDLADTRQLMDELSEIDGQSPEYQKYRDFLTSEISKVLPTIKKKAVFYKGNPDPKKREIGKTLMKTIIALDELDGEYAQWAKRYVH